MCAASIEDLFLGANPSIIDQCLELAKNYKHVMEFTYIRVLESTFALIRKGISNLLDF